MLNFRKIRTFSFLILSIMITFGGVSCGKKIYPSGLEGNLHGQKGNFKREQQKRKFTAFKARVKHNWDERKADRPIAKQKKLADKELEKFKKRHLNQQHPDVQARMKENFRNTKRSYASKKCFLGNLVF
jgi:hypothetical protein